MSEYRDILMENVKFVERDMEDCLVPKKQQEPIIQIRGEIALWAIQSIHKRELRSIVDVREDARAVIRSAIRAKLYGGMRHEINRLGEQFLMHEVPNIKAINELMQGLHNLFPRVR